MFLSDLNENQLGVISDFKFEKNFENRLKDMGFCKGEEVKCVKKAVFHSPILYFVKGANVALRKSDACRIEVIQ